MSVAESILFAGKAVRVLRNPSPAFRFQDADYHQHNPRGSQKLQGFVERFSFQKEPSLDTKVGEELLPQFEANKIEDMLQDLKVSFFVHTPDLDIVLCDLFWIDLHVIWSFLFTGCILCLVFCASIVMGVVVVTTLLLLSKILGGLCAGIV